MGAVSPGADGVQLGANHPKSVKIGPFTLLLVSEMGWWLCPMELEPLLPPQLKASPLARCWPGWEARWILLCLVRH